MSLHHLQAGGDARDGDRGRRVLGAVVVAERERQLHRVLRHGPEHFRRALAAGLRALPARMGSGIVSGEKLLSIS